MNMSEAVERMERAFPRQSFIFNVRVQRTMHTSSGPSMTIAYSLSLFPEFGEGAPEISFGPSLENVVEQQLAKRHPVTTEEVDLALADMPAVRG